MKELMKFDFEGRGVRSLMIAGEPWWVVKDVCEVLGIADHHQVFERLDEDERGRYPIPTRGGEQEAKCVNEFGLYTLIIRSDKPEAKAFRKWITSEVLPAIRKTGRYAVDKDKRRQSAKTRVGMTAQWQIHGASSPHHFINLTRTEYRSLGWPSATKKDFLTDEERARLQVFESIETYKLMRNPQIEGYHELAESLIETGSHIGLFVDNYLARKLIEGGHP